ncbi:hypothetical protein OS493_031023 [Desmophyllum pertusum]|uniref:Uncharacterized protein n=1 Tax=Desmophyllum pertusum TaxID=174260 RepID=A0A9W9Z946_9CNID|nr:hypothetical protein OS493_031023 [Desmophyllum pertusum]
MYQLRVVQKQGGHKGLAIEQVGIRQQQRQLRELREKAQKALWFAETYGLNLKSLNMEDSTGKQINVTSMQVKATLEYSNSFTLKGMKNQTPTQNTFLYPADATSSAERGVQNDNICTTVPHQPESTSQPNQPYESLNDDEKDQIKMILYIMDRFSISLEGYHELSQVEKSLPRTYLIESCTKVLDSKWTVTKTPGNAQGAELPLKLLLENEIRQQLKNNNGTGEAIKVKISGDGTRMSHSSNIFVLTFALVEDDQKCLSSSGNHAVAIVKEKENYDALKESLANVIRDVNALIEVGHMIVDGQRVNLDFYLGGDYKDDNQTRSSRQKTDVHLQEFQTAVRSLGVSLRVYCNNDKWEWTSLLGKEKKTIIKKITRSL